MRYRRRTRRTITLHSLLPRSSALGHSARTPAEARVMRARFEVLESNRTHRFPVVKWVRLYRNAASRSVPSHVWWKRHSEMGEGEREAKLPLEGSYLRTEGVNVTSSQFRDHLAALNWRPVTIGETVQLQKRDTRFRRTFHRRSLFPQPLSKSSSKRTLW